VTEQQFTRNVDLRDEHLQDAAEKKSEEKQTVAFIKSRPYTPQMVLDMA
jgi:hypothetical protein